MTLASAWPQAAAGAMTLLYNGLVHRAYQSEVGDRSAVFPAAAAYLLSAVAISTLMKALMLRRVRRVLARPQDGSAGDALMMFLVFQGLISSVGWLMSIPVLGSVAAQAYGSVHPISFPHFCASVVVGWLVSATYSTLLCIRRWSQEPTWEGSARAPMLAIARVLPFAAAGVPLVAGAMFLFFVSPGAVPSTAYKGLLGFLVGLATVGGYGCVFCARMTDELKIS